MTFLPRRSRFTDRELHILYTKIKRDHPMKGRKKKKLGWEAFKQTFRNWRLWLHFAITILNNGPQRALDTYSPLIVKSFGFSALTSNALAAVGLFAQIPMSFVSGFLWDQFGLRGETVMLGLSMHLLGWIMNRIFTELNGHRGAKYFGVVWSQTFGFFPHSLNVAWMLLSCRDSEEKAIAMAMIIIAANLAGIYGAQIIRSDDRPRYIRGFSVACALVALALIVALVRYGLDFFVRRGSKIEVGKKEGSRTTMDSDQDVRDVDAEKIDTDSKV